MNGSNPAGKKERGTSLVEVLVAMLLLVVLMVSILQMFSMVFLTNMGAAARSELMYRCQDTVEHLRYLNHLANMDVAIQPEEATGLNFPIMGGTPEAPLTLRIPNPDGGYAGLEYWGPNGANLIPEEGSPPYEIIIEIVDPNPGVAGVPLDVTVTARPTTQEGAQRYTLSARRKVVQYVSQIPR